MRSSVTFLKCKNKLTYLSNWHLRLFWRSCFYDFRCPCQKIVTFFRTLTSLLDPRQHYCSFNQKLWLLIHIFMIICVCVCVCVCVREREKNSVWHKEIEKECKYVCVCVVSISMLKSGWRILKEEFFVRIIQDYV